MGFSVKQVQALRRHPGRRHIRTREAHGRELTYLEGWYAISEANRIFGFDGWNRETVESKCVLARENRGTFLAVYIARVRVTVLADGATIIREGHGSGEGHGPSPGEVHDISLKAAETDATKRALATFGKPFGLALYGTGTKVAATPTRIADQSHHVGQRHHQVRLPPDDTTPIPRPSRYYGRRQDLVTRDRTQARHIPPLLPPSHGSSIVPSAPGLVPPQIDKSSLAISEPRRIRDKVHLRFVASQACLVCGRQPCDPHHLRFAQPRAMGLKVSDEFTVPLCRSHHSDLHRYGDETVWWAKHKLEPLNVAAELWRQSHPLPSMPDVLSTHQVAIDMRTDPKGGDNDLVVASASKNDETRPIVPSGSQ
jgi:Rad52/22 family double-strand break repair protein